jgi:alkylhydroperoxidase family enzyme
MGHSEMLLAVAGMKQADIEKLTAKLAKGDWSGFPVEEQVAFRFANKLAAKPAAVTDADVKELVTAFGPHRAIDLIWYVSWVNYMTRVADGLQLPLETTNVFAPPAKK